MIIVPGEILYDVFDEYERPGGASFNFAYNMKNLGEVVRFISRVGSDSRGSEIKRFINSCGFSEQDIQTDREHSTGIVRVSLDENGIPDFNILSDAAYDYIEFKSDVDSKSSDLIYYGTLIQRSNSGYRSLNKFLSATDNSCIKFCDINLRRGCYSSETVISSLEHADILKMNRQELTEVINITGLVSSHESAVISLSAMFAIGTIAVTDGGGDCFIYAGGKFYRQTPEKIDDIADTVGAGDAFSAVLAFGILRKWDMGRILDRALYLSSKICQEKGALCSDDRIYREVIVKPVLAE